MYRWCLWDTLGICQTASVYSVHDRAQFEVDTTADRQSVWCGRDDDDVAAASTATDDDDDDDDDNLFIVYSSHKSEKIRIHKCQILHTAHMLKC